MLEITIAFANSFDNIIIKCEVSCDLVIFYFSKFCEDFEYIAQKFFLRFGNHNEFPDF